jgi:predicted nuclease of predicted toxin-antitoxin system
MLFFLDECVPASALKMLRDQGYEAFSITEFIQPGSPDQLVAAVTEDNGAILISHDKDFKLFASRRIDGQAKRFKKLHCVRMECKEPRIPERLRNALNIIKLEFDQRKLEKDKRVILNVKSDVVTIHR